MDEQSFIKANANKDYICSEFTEVLRDLIRSVSAEEDYQGGLHRSIRQMSYIMDLVSECEEGV